MTTPPTLPGADWLEAFDINDQSMADDPYAVYERLRAVGPVVFTPRMGFVVTSFAVADEVLRDWETFVSTEGKGPNPAAVQRRMDGSALKHTYADFPVVPIEVDPPEHGAYRRLVGSDFSAPMVRKSWGDMIVETARELLRGLEGRDEADLATEFAIPMAGLVLADAMGLPGQDRPLFQAWATDIDAHMAELDTYLRSSISTARSGIFAKLGQVEIDGRPLTDAEQTGFGLILIHAGWESTGSAIARAALHLATHPASRDILRADPARIPAAVEELLRTDTPAQALWRTASRDVELAGVQIPKGEKVLVLWGAANRDPETFADATVTDLERSPNHHMVFGRGVHTCLGQHLARLELTVAIEQLLLHFPDLSLAPDASVVVHQGAVRAIKSLPVRLGRQEVSR